MFAHDVSGNDFIKAAKAGDLEVVRQYITENAENPAAINQAEFGGTAILAAAANGHAHIVAELLKVPELDVNAGNGVGSTPIFVASAKGHVDVVRLLIADKRTDINARTDFGDFPLMSAIIEKRAAIVILLLSAGATVNDDEWRQIAIDKNLTEIVHFLSEWKVEIKKYSEIGMLLLPYLTESDQLRWRSTSRFYRAALQNKQVAPWQTKAQFCMAITGNFNVNKWDWGGTLNDSWTYYCKIISDDDNQPALIHKISAHDKDNYSTESERYRMKSNGRIYDPGFTHNWAYNAIWMLANIHKGRSFLVISELEERYLIRQSSSSSSAFAREMAAAMQAKYTPCVLADNLLRLMPPDHTVRSQVKLCDMKLSDAQVAIFYRQCKNYKDNPPKQVLATELSSDEESDQQNQKKRHIKREGVNDSDIELDELAPTMNKLEI